MGETNSAIKDVKEAADEVAEKVGKNPWVERLARFGYAAKGVVYIVVGALATLAALGMGGETTGTKGAMRSIVRQPFGRVMLGVVAFGLLGYVIWRLVQAITDADDKGTNAKGIALRLGYTGSGLVYAGLAYSAARILFGASDDGQPSAAESWTARVMEFPFGNWLVVLGGLSVIGYGLYQCYKGYTAKFRKRLKTGEMSERGILWATRSGRFGFIARGIVFLIVGGFLIVAAWHYDSSQAKGLDGALQVLIQQSYGKWLLGGVALGLVAYGLYMLIEARYRRIAGS
ncbi:MAG: hypothetical protein QOD32_1232 [Pyrinomonadaceae bacterium]|jgi:hypothetical protein|nr:hypothetical protein [Pyrinomonadaceae bacterium]